MRRKRIFLKSILLCLMIVLSYTQVIQLVHSPHAGKSSTETTQYNTSEFSCYICYVIQHSQAQQYCSFVNASLLVYSPNSTDVYSGTVQEHPLLLTRQGKNKSPPLS